jgi:hypothetical protein
MDTALARRVIRSLTPYAFSLEDVAFAKQLFSTLTGDEFKPLRDAPIEVVTTEHENDTLNIGAYCMQATLEEIKTVAGPRWGKVFSVSTFEQIPATYDEPGDVVDSPVGDSDHLYGALNLIALHEMQQYLKAARYSIAVPR